MLKTKGIVIKEMKYGDTSKIITIYTEDKGKISVMARGANNPKSKLIAPTQIFTLSDYQFKSGRNFYFISQVDIINSFYSIREDIDRVIYGYYILELADKSISIEQENKNIYALLKRGLEVLSKLEDDYLKFVIAYEIKFISFLGYKPFLEACVNCNSKKANQIKFSIEKGGIICDKCFSEDQFSKPMNKNIYNLMVEFLYAKLDDLENIKAREEDLNILHDILVNYILTSVDRKKFNSLQLLEGLND